MRKYGRNIKALLLLVLFVVYWSNITLFYHVHTVDDQVYVHSHFFSGSASHPTHTHTAQQFQLIAQLSLLLATAAVAVVFASLLPKRSFVYSVPGQEVFRVLSIRIPGLRAPPVC